MGGKTVIRGGVGVFYFTYGARGINQPGFSQTTPMVTTLDGYLTPPPRCPIRSPAASCSPSAPLGPGHVPRPGRGLLQPAQLDSRTRVRWNLDVQRKSARNMVMEAGYIGNHAVHLGENRDLNYMPRKYLSTLAVSATRPTSTASPPTCQPVRATCCRAPR